MKSILISIKPKHCANILNELKTKEIRKLFPKDYRGWIYIYCTKDNTYGLFEVWDKECYEAPLTFIGYHAISRKQYSFNDDEDLSGKVIARFYCDNVEEIHSFQHKPTIFFPYKNVYFLENDSPEHLKEISCLSYNEIDKYLNGSNGRAINISKLEIFDTPKELSEFRHKIFFYKYDMNYDTKMKMSTIVPIKRPPQSYMYIEELLWVKV